MDPILANVLLEKNLLKNEMEIDVTYHTAALGNVNTVPTIGSFMIRAVKQAQDGSLRFVVSSVLDGHLRVVNVNSIVGIDGMDTVRFAAVYDLDANGQPKKVGKRRGRKPKLRNPDGTVMLTTVPGSLDASTEIEANNEDEDEDNEEDEAA